MICTVTVTVTPRRNERANDLHAQPSYLVTHPAAVLHVIFLQVAREAAVRLSFLISNVKLKHG